MGDTVITNIAKTRKVMLKLTSNMALTLNSFMHVLTIRKNFVSAALLVKNGFRCGLASDKGVISKNKMFIEKVHLNEGIFKLSVMVVEY